MVTLLGGGGIAPGELAEVLALAPVLVAADGGAEAALKAGQMPLAVIGDFDSLSAEARAAIPPERLHEITEQQTTDFDKCLRAISAPVILGLGFLGARLDHQLAALSGLVRRPKSRCILLGDRDLAFLCPPRLVLRLPVGTRLSLFPMGAVTGASTGLKWPIDGLDLAPDGRIGTSNEVVAEEVTLRTDSAKLVAILPRATLKAVIAGLRAEPAISSSAR